MSPALKIFLGGLATLALAWVSYTYKGSAFIAGLDAEAKAAFASVSLLVQLMIGLLVLYLAGLAVGWLIWGAKRA